MTMKRVLRFTASWCNPCKMLAENLKQVQSSVPIETYDIDERNDLAIEFGIRSVPTLVMMEENVEIKRYSGVMQKPDLTKWLND